jgi:ABC-type sulfate/molybdate transport systems ATPase subunit
MELLSEIHTSGNTILFVTHNPELTRYASRVVYMHDGAIVQDEQTKVGEVAHTALQQMYIAPVKTAEDDLAGVSALMKALPFKDEASSEAKPKPKPAKTSKARLKTKPAKTAKTIRPKKALQTLPKVRQRRRGKGGRP